MIIYIHYLTRRVSYHFLKSENILNFHVNCGMMLEPVPAQPLPLRNVDISTTILLNKLENIDIYKVAPNAIS